MNFLSGFYAHDSDDQMEREHMFDKVVTPSDVGKLNRLVIPKQHAERYFPLDSSANDKGLLLNFEDRDGKPWRFRYSYWNSSQSYVMTKGWSRFVKEKNLDAGDIVSFQRGVGELAKDRLFIDWRRRHHHPPPIPVLYRPNFVQPQWYQNIPSRNPWQVGGSMVFNSVPVVEGKAAAKRLRLFGVNMECPIPEPDECHSHILSSSSVPPEDKGKASMSLDLDI